MDSNQHKEGEHSEADSSCCYPNGKCSVNVRWLQVQMNEKGLLLVAAKTAVAKRQIRLQPV